MKSLKSIIIVAIVTLGILTNNILLTAESVTIIEPCVYELDGSLSKDSSMPCKPRTRTHEYGPG
ncbi:hypothetical protein [Anaerorhabdus sp.]|uniref:hypothetical protein n=1 Tax=Anaerorhabdus sp. TaxID=1872524 RepID=UPI002FC7D565